LKVKVRAFGELIALLGSELTEELQSNARLDGLLSTLGAKAKSFIEGFIEPYNVAENLIVLVNGHNASTLPDPYPLNDCDVVMLLSPFISG
jgi:molybdopterin converting factor small subunit